MLSADISLPLKFEFCHKQTFVFRKWEGGFVLPPALCPRPPIKSDLLLATGRSVASVCHRTPEW